MQAAYSSTPVDYMVLHCDALLFQINFSHRTFCYLLNSYVHSLRSTTTLFCDFKMAKSVFEVLSNH